MSAIQTGLPLQLRQSRGLAASWGPAPQPPHRSGVAGAAVRERIRPLAIWSPATLHPVRGVMRDLSVGLVLAMLVVEAILAFSGG
ncbi:MAG: hypothetical protein JWO24_1279 [Rhodospirillales bacterium]|jgi:hypothetical protein|nr:hypothetical protein [Rhodospirillales bacterium]